jgi:hypothetical protein
MNPIESKINRLCDLVESQDKEIKTLHNERRSARVAKAEASLAEAVNAGRIAPGDTSTKAFWIGSLLRDHGSAVKALESLPVNPVLAKVTDGDDPKSGALNKMQLQQQKLSEIRASHPQADFPTIFAKAQSEAPDLFR